VFLAFAASHCHSNVNYSLLRRKCRTRDVPCQFRAGLVDGESCRPWGQRYRRRFSDRPAAIMATNRRGMMAMAILTGRQHCSDRHSESEVIASIRLVSNLMPYYHPRNIPFRLLRTVPWFSQEFSVWDRDLNHSTVRCRLQRHGCRMTQSVGDKRLCRLMSRSVVARRRSLLAAM
jgi:hypothetical protein